MIVYHRKEDWRIPLPPEDGSLLRLIFMNQRFIDRAIAEEGRGKAKWGQVDRTPQDLMIAIQEELGEVAHAINHNEGSSVVQQEIVEVVGLLSRLFDMEEGVG